MTKVSIAVAGQSLTATLNDSPAAKDFASLPPLTLTPADCAVTGKIGGLPRPLTRTGGRRVPSHRRGEAGRAIDRQTRADFRWASGAAGTLSAAHGFIKRARANHRRAAGSL
jgi:hypothetical protein